MSRVTEPKREFLPPVNRSMLTLDRDFFKREIPLVAARLKNPAYLTKLTKDSRDDLLQLQGIPRIVDIDSSKAILLKHQVTDPGLVTSQVEPHTLRQLEMAEATYHKHTLTLDYSYWRSDEILAAVLPEDLLEEVPSGFTNVGHIAHMNIREEFLPYKKLIGQVILDKNPAIKTVVNKLDSIHTVYRNFEMEVVAGEENFMVEQSESGCKFRFDFSKVYWNSRLHTEHDRLVKQFAKGSVVCDVMAGVGPFAIPAGKKGVIVFANDLNPDSYEAMVDNIKLNKVAPTVFPSNEDGRRFIRESVARILTLAQDKKVIEIPPRRPSRSKPQSSEKVPIPRYPSHYVMNLPDSALEFLDAFRGLYSDELLRSEAFGCSTLSSSNMPFIHVHCFYKWDPTTAEPTEEECHEDLRGTVSKYLDFEIDKSELSFHKVRKVAPTKTMFCISFRLPVEVAMAKN